eukprot:scaffold200030_cov15-Tisochrysis_lutea.AAC.1
MEKRNQRTGDFRLFQANASHLTLLLCLCRFFLHKDYRIKETKGLQQEEAKAREASPDVVRLPGGGDIYGGDESIAVARAREASRQSAQRNRQLLKQEEVSHRAAAAQAKAYKAKRNLNGQTWGGHT